MSIFEKRKFVLIIFVISLLFALSFLSGSDIVFAQAGDDGQVQEQPGNKDVPVHQVEVPTYIKKPVPPPEDLLSGNLTTVRSIRFGSNKDGIRIVMDFSKKYIYQVRSIKDSSVIYVDIYNAVLADGFQVPRFKADPLLSSVSVKQYNPRQVRMTLKLRYGVPIDNVDTIELKNPQRLAIDLFREYNNFIQFHITKNIVWLQTERASSGRFTLINELYVNHKSPDVTVDVELAKNTGKSREVVCNLVKRKGAIAGVNGGYFSNSGQNLGLIVKEGKVLAPSVKRRPPRTAFGITFDNKIVFNRVIDKNGKLITAWGKVWDSVVMALGAGPRVISDGKVHITAQQEGLGKGGNDITRRTGRTALGVTKDGNLALFTFSGFRNNHKDGVKLEDMGKYLLSRKIMDAMNLDGGGSTAMSIMGYPVGKPPQQGKYQRPVANCVLIYDKSPVISPCHIAIEPRQIVMPADGISETRLRILVCDRNQKPVPDGTAIAFASGAGLIKKKYAYTKNGLADVIVKSARAPGSYSLKVECGPLRTFIPMRLTNGETVSMVADAKILKAVPDSKGSTVKADKKDDTNDFEKEESDDDEEDDPDANQPGGSGGSGDNSGNGSGGNGKGSSDNGRSGSDGNSNGNGGNSSANGRDTSDTGKDLTANGKGSRFILQALVRDEYGNPVKGAAVKFTLIEGKGALSGCNIATKANGVADVSFTLLSDKAKVMITSGNMEPVYKEF